MAIWVALASVAAFIPGGLNPWLFPKAALLVVAAALASSASGAGRLPRAYWWFAGTAAGLLLVASATTNAPLAQLIGRWPRYDGLVALPVFIVAAWAGARLLGPQSSRSRFESAVYAAAALAIASGVVSALELTDWRVTASDLARAGGLLGNATDQGIVGAALACVLASVVAGRLGRGHVSVSRLLMPGAGVVGAVVTLVASGSRAAVLAFACGIVLLAVLTAVLNRHRGCLRRQLLTLGAVAGLCILTLFAIPLSLTRLLGASPLASATISDRAIMWSETLRLISDHPVLGVGPSGFAESIPRYHTGDWYAAVDTGTVLDAPHNVLLQITTSGGLLLLAVAVVFAGWCVWRSTRVLRDAASERSSDADPGRLDFVVGAGVGALVITLAWLTHFPTMPTGILLGLLGGVVLATEPTDIAHGLGRARTVGLSLWALLLCLASLAELPQSTGVAAAASAAPSAADRAFSAAQAFRPWDPSIASIATQSFTAAASAGDQAALPYALEWGERATSIEPRDLPAALALATARRLSGDPSGSAALLTEMIPEAPNDPSLAAQRSISLFYAGDIHASLTEIERAHALAPDDPDIIELRDEIKAAAEATK